MARVEVRDDTANGRFVASVDGSDAGSAYYQLDGDDVVFTHTEVDPKYGGKGVGSALAQGALDAVRDSDLRAVPRCPFIAAYIARHDQYADLVPNRYRSLIRTES